MVFRIQLLDAGPQIESAPEGRTGFGHRRGAHLKDAREVGLGERLRLRIFRRDPGHAAHREIREVAPGETLDGRKHPVLFRQLRVVHFCLQRCDEIHGVAGVAVTTVKLRRLVRVFPSDPGGRLRFAQYLRLFGISTHEKRLLSARWSAHFGSFTAIQLKPAADCCQGGLALARPDGEPSLEGLIARSVGGRCCGVYS